jgi:ubiquinone/menaquinone biosynthesis C-methylase UbiE
MTASFAHYPGLRAEVLGFFDAVAPGPVLDIGCGSGRDGVLGADDGGCWVVFADSALGMLRTALVRCQEAVVCCDVTRLPFGDAVFKGVIASGVLLHIPKRHCPWALAELRRVLRPEGRVSISMKAGAGEGWRRTADFPMARWFISTVSRSLPICVRRAAFAWMTCGGVAGEPGSPSWRPNPEQDQLKRWEPRPRLGSPAWR